MSAKRAVEHMRALSEKSDDPINLCISSPGGHIDSGDMLHDMIKFIDPKNALYWQRLGCQRRRPKLHWCGFEKLLLPAQYAFLAASTQRRHLGGKPAT